MILTITAEDYAKATEFRAKMHNGEKGSVDVYICNCLVAQALKRTLGGEWVANYRSARRPGGPRLVDFPDDLQAAIRQFDADGSFTPDQQYNVYLNSLAADNLAH